MKEVQPATEAESVLERKFGEDTGLVLRVTELLAKV
jgi:hypothetical protein